LLVALLRKKIDNPQQEVASGDTQKVPSYEYHKKLLGQHKTLKSQYEELQARMQKVEEEKMVAEGNKDELISSLRERLDKTESASKQMQANYAYNVVSGQVMQEAAKMGCVDTEALLQLADLTQLEADENYNVYATQVKELLEMAKSKRPYLFQKAAPKIAVGTPTTSDLEPKSWTETKDKTELLKAALMRENG